jgi:hypothetical protein
VTRSAARPAFTLWSCSSSSASSRCFSGGCCRPCSESGPPPRRPSEPTTSSNSAWPRTTSTTQSAVSRPASACSGKDPYHLQTWLAQLLPYLEEDALWRTNLEGYRISRSPFRKPPHTGLPTVAPMFICPADGWLRTPQLAQRDRFMVAFTSYLGVEGLDATKLDGVLYRDSPT